MTVERAWSGLRSPTGCPVSRLAADFDPLEGDYQLDPAGSLQAAQHEEPVFYSPRLDSWVVTRYRDIREILKATDVFSPSNANDPITPLCDEAVEVLTHYRFMPSGALVDEDEPVHTLHRRLLQEPFEPDRVAAHEPEVRQVVTEYLDRIVGNGQADLTDELLFDVPCIVALMFLGVSDEDIQTWRTYGLNLTMFQWGRPTGAEQVRAATELGRFWEFAGRMVPKIKADPQARGWLPHAVAMQREHPDLIDDNYLQTMCMAGSVAAHETTTNAAGNAFRTLLENRSAWDQLCAEPGLIPKAVEECLRYSPSVVAWRRKALADTMVGGVRIPAGGSLLMVFAAANRDSSIFENPDVFDLHRRNSRRHLTFGTGSHTCMGAALARMEIKVLLQEVTRRLPHLELVADQEFSYLPNTSFRGPEHLFVQWDPARNPVTADRP